LADPAKGKPRPERNRDARAKAEEVVARSFKTGARPTVHVDVFNGGITIVADATNEVAARVTKESRADTEEEAKAGLSNIDVEMKQDGDTVRITTRRKDRDRPFRETASAEVRVPAGAVLKLNTSNGTVKIAGGTGVVEVETANGPIMVKDNKGALKLTSRNGEIDVIGANGKVELKTANGRIHLHAERATVTAESGNGEVHFNGMLADGEHRFASGNGRIVVVLPTDARFKVDASTSLGSIRNEFGEGKTPKVGGASVKAAVGDNPKAILKVETGRGGIEIRKKKD
jgi:Putative adhesin